MMLAEASAPLRRLRPHILTSAADILTRPGWAARSCAICRAQAADARNGRRAVHTGNASAGEDKAQRRGKVIFSGIQPTGVPHLGNYLGALSNWVDMQRSAAPEDTLLFCSVGLHALTMPQDPARLRRERRDMMATLLAIGLDPDRCVIFQQEHVPTHAELAWLFNCITSVGKLRRMTTWKSKIAIARNSGESNDSAAQAATEEGELNLGLLAYPVLQAADILLYRATHVPVGEDQVQHLELSRDIAEGFNRQFKSRLFPPPKHIITPSKRVLSLRDPTQKMSKSAPDPNSRILLTDSPKQIEAKIKRAVTDSDRQLAYDPEARPGVSNLLSILAALRSRSGSAEIGAQSVADELNAAHGGTPGAGPLKAALSDAVIQTLNPIREEVELLQADPGYLDELTRKGAEKAGAMAERTMQDVRRAVGLA